jgi:hypothetical protein
MTVAELIKKLQKMPQDLEVIVPTPDHYAGCSHDTPDIIRIRRFDSHGYPVNRNNYIPPDDIIRSVMIECSTKRRIQRG